MKYLRIAVAFSLMASCQQGPKVIEAEESEAKEIFNSETEHSSASGHSGAHHVVVKDTLQGDRYTYLKVLEGDHEYWLATLKGDFQLEEEYHFENGLYKTDYYSTTFDRNFAELYLVSELRPAFSEGQKNALNAIFNQGEVTQGKTGNGAETGDIEALEGSISIKELIQNADDWIGKEVQITAKVTKLNAHIMDRHWLHLKDGSFDSFDMVATSQTAVPVGHIVSLKATLNKNVDFGAGYSYDLILENAELIP